MVTYLNYDFGNFFFIYTVEISKQNKTSLKEDIFR